MIRSLEELAKRMDFDRERYGDKSVLLAELRNDIETEGFRSVKPSGYVSDVVKPEEQELRDVFDHLVGKISTSVDKRKVGAIYCRSSGYGEKSGVNDSIPVVYDSNDHEGSWQRFRGAFDSVRHNSEKEGDIPKPVLMQILQGEIEFSDTDYRKIVPFTWPRSPAQDEENWDEITAPVRKAIERSIKKERINPKKGSVHFYFVNEEGVLVDKILINDMKRPDGRIRNVWGILEGNNRYREQLMGNDVDLSSGFEDYRCLDENRDVMDFNRNVVAREGTVVYTAEKEVPSKPVIGSQNKSFVARSHDFREPDHASLIVAIGLASYIVDGIPAKCLESPKGRMIHYFDLRTAKHEREVNLGQPVVTSSKTYRQSHVEAFSVNSAEIVALDWGNEHINFHQPVTGNMRAGQEIIKIADFYSKKRGKPVEIEGAVIDGELHIFQVTDYDLPTDLIPELSEVPDGNLIYADNCGRAAICFEGDIVIQQEDEVVEPHDGALVLGFDPSVTKRDRFLYFDKSDSAMLKLGRRFSYLGEHMKTYAMQVSFEATDSGRQGGVFFVGSPEDFLEEIADSIEERDGRKVIPNVRVEACREGMQIYKA